MYDEVDVLSLFIGKDEKYLRVTSSSVSDGGLAASMLIGRSVELRSIAAEEGCILCWG